jgi:protein-S-isoprenylcysteine O-methyltransferase Ste14
MSEATDNAGVLIHPPIALLLAVVAGFALKWLYPLPFVAAEIRGAWIGAALFMLGLMLAVWAFTTFRAAGTRVETHRSTSTIVADGPYRLMRNPIYVGMLLGLIGLAVAFDDAWLLAAAVPFYVVIRFGVVAREEAYLEGKFGGAYRAYKTRVRRWF